MPETKTTQQPSAPAAKPQEPTTNEVVSSIYGGALKMNKFSSIGSLIGFVGGLMFASSNNKSGFFTYVGHGILGMSVGLAAGSLTDKVIQVTKK